MSRVFTLLLSGFAIATLAAGADLPVQKVLTLDVAQDIAAGALESCRAAGFKITITVLDASNGIKFFLRDDGSGLASTEISRMKAATVIMFGRPSGPPPDLPPGRPVPAPFLPGTTNAQGGFPIKVGDETIGAVGVSGAPSGDKDAVCAEAGLKKVAERLK